MVESSDDAKTNSKSKNKSLQAFRSEPNLRNVGGPRRPFMRPGHFGAQDDSRIVELVHPPQPKTLDEMRTNLRNPQHSEAAESSVAPKNLSDVAHQQQQQQQQQQTQQQKQPQGNVKPPPPSTPNPGRLSNSTPNPDSGGTSVASSAIPAHFFVYMTWFDDTVQLARTRRVVRVDHKHLPNMAHMRSCALQCLGVTASSSLGISSVVAHRVVIETVDEELNFEIEDESELHQIIRSRLAVRRPVHFRIRRAQPLAERDHPIEGLEGSRALADGSQSIWGRNHMTAEDEIANKTRHRSIAANAIKGKRKAVPNGLPPNLVPIFEVTPFANAEGNNGQSSKNDEVVQETLVTELEHTLRSFKVDTSSWKATFGAKTVKDLLEEMRDGTGSLYADANGVIRVVNLVRVKIGNTVNSKSLVESKKFQAGSGQTTKVNKLLARKYRAEDGPFPEAMRAIQEEIGHDIWGPVSGQGARPGFTWLENLMLHVHPLAFREKSHEESSSNSFPGLRSWHLIDTLIVKVVYPEMPVVNTWVTKDHSSAGTSRLWKWVENASARNLMLPQNMCENEHMPQGANSPVAKSQVVSGTGPGTNAMAQSADAAAGAKSTAQVPGSSSIYYRLKHVFVNNRAGFGAGAGLASQASENDLPPQPEQFPGKYAQFLAIWLRQRGVLTELWGAPHGVTKSIEDLIVEMKKKETELQLINGKPVRIVRVAKVEVQNGLHKGRILVETHQRITNTAKPGKAKFKIRHLLLSEKFAPSELPWDAAKRGIREELLECDTIVDTGRPVVSAPPSSPTVSPTHDSNSSIFGDLNIAHVGNITPEKLTTIDSLNSEDKHEDPKHPEQQQNSPKNKMRRRSTTSVGVLVPSVDKKTGLPATGIDAAEGALDGEAKRNKGLASAVRKSKHHSPVGVNISANLKPTAHVGARKHGNTFMDDSALANMSEEELAELRVHLVDMLPPEIEDEYSPSYPGLMTRYILHRFVVEVDGLEHNHSFCTVEEKKGLLEKKSFRLATGKGKGKGSLGGGIPRTGMKVVRNHVHKGAAHMHHGALNQHQQGQGGVAVMGVGYTHHHWRWMTRGEYRRMEASLILKLEDYFALIRQAGDEHKTADPGELEKFLFKAADKDDVRVVRFLAAIPPSGQPPWLPIRKVMDRKTGATPLRNAALANARQVVQELIVLMLTKGKVMSLQALIKHEVRIGGFDDVNQRDKFGCTMIYYAAMVDHAELVEALLSMDGVASNSVCLHSCVERRSNRTLGILLPRLRHLYTLSSMAEMENDHELPMERFGPRQVMRTRNPEFEALSARRPSNRSKISRGKQYDGENKYMNENNNYAKDSAIDYLAGGNDFHKSNFTFGTAAQVVTATRRGHNKRGRGVNGVDLNRRRSDPNQGVGGAEHNGSGSPTRDRRTALQSIANTNDADFDLASPEYFRSLLSVAAEMLARDTQESQQQGQRENNNANNTSNNSSNQNGSASDLNQQHNDPGNQHSGRKATMKAYDRTRGKWEVVTTLEIVLQNCNPMWPPYREYLGVFLHAIVQLDNFEEEAELISQFIQLSDLSLHVAITAAHVMRQARITSPRFWDACDAHSSRLQNMICSILDCCMDQQEAEHLLRERADLYTRPNVEDYWAREGTMTDQQKYKSTCSYLAVKYELKDVVAHKYFTTQNHDVWYSSSDSMYIWFLAGQSASAGGSGILDRRLLGKIYRAFVSVFLLCIVVLITPLLAVLPFSNQLRRIVDIPRTELNCCYFKWTAWSYSYMGFLACVVLVALETPVIPDDGMINTNDTSGLLVNSPLYLNGKMTALEIVFALYLFANIVAVFEQLGNVELRTFLSHKVNLVDCFSWLCFTLAFSSLMLATESRGGSVYNVCMSLGSLSSVFRVFHLFSSSKSLGPLWVAIQFVWWDVARFACLLTVVVFAFVLALVFLLRDGSVRGFKSLSETLTSLLWSIYEPFQGYDNPAEQQHQNFLYQTFLFTFMLFAALLLTNLLIAMMTDRYNAVQQTARKEWLFSLAQLIDKYSNMPLVPAPFNLLVFFPNFIFRLIWGRESLYDPIDTRLAREMRQEQQRQLELYQQQQQEQDHLNYGNNSLVPQAQPNKPWMSKTLRLTNWKPRSQRNSVHPSGGLNDGGDQSPKGALGKSPFRSIGNLLWSNTGEKAVSGRGIGGLSRASSTFRPRNKRRNSRTGTRDQGQIEYSSRELVMGVAFRRHSVYNNLRYRSSRNLVMERFRAKCKKEALCKNELNRTMYRVENSVQTVRLGVQRLLEETAVEEDN